MDFIYVGDLIVKFHKIQICSSNYLTNLTHLNRTRTLSFTLNNMILWTFIPNCNRTLVTYFLMQCLDDKNNIIDNLYILVVLVDYHLALTCRFFSPNFSLLIYIISQ